MSGSGLFYYFRVYFSAMGKAKKLLNICFGFVVVGGLLSLGYSWYKQHLRNRKIENLVSVINLQNRMLLSRSDMIGRIVPGILLGSSFNYAMLDCFQGKGKNCLSYVGQNFEFTDPLVAKTKKLSVDAKPCNDGTDCVVERAMSFNLACSSEHSCETIHLTAVSKTIQGAELMKEYKTSFDARAAFQARKVSDPGSKVVEDAKAGKASGGFLSKFFSKSASPMAASSEPPPHALQGQDPQTAIKLQELAEKAKAKKAPAQAR